MSHGKPPFEKIRSQVEKRKLFQELINAKSEIVTKGDDDSFFQLVPQKIINDSILLCGLINIEKLPQKDIKAIGNFSVGTDRYFFSGALKVMKDEAAFDISCDVFQLQRRATFRLSVRPQSGLFIALTKFDKKAIYVITQVADISAGGARVFFGETYSTTGITGTSVDPGLKMGSQFTCVIHPPSGKNIEVQAEVKHQQKAVVNGEITEQFGIEFINLSPLLKNRLTSMTLDLQQKFVNEF
jgi:hypothetical protein